MIIHRLRNIFVVLFCTVLYSSSYAQSLQHIKSDNDTYLWGEGWGTTVAEADKQAISMLISKISMVVSSDFKMMEGESISEGDVNYKKQVENRINTYSAATLTNTESIIVSNEPDAHVVRWIKRSEIEKIFVSRIAKVKDMVLEASLSEQKGKVDDALRNYYWAFTLLKSVQRPNDVEITDQNGEKRLLVNLIPARMNEIFSSLEVKVSKRNEDVVELQILYKGKPVNSLDYTYFDGRAWSNIYSAKDGVGILELAQGNTSSVYQLKYEFEYRGQAHIDPEVKAVMDVEKSTPMKKAYTNISSKEAEIQLNSSESFTSTDSSILKEPRLLEDAAPYTEIMNKIIRAITSKSTANIRSYFTDEGWEVYNSLICYGNARVVGEPYLKFLQYGDAVIGRGVQMSFSFKSGARKSFVEDVVFTFDADAKICNLAFGLGNTAVDDILNKGVWSEEARLGIMAFLENYKTAYSLKRLDYITSIFDDEAVIIVGRVVKNTRSIKTTDTAAPLTYNNPIIQRNRYTKDQYLRNLSACFARNEFINIRFSNNDVYKLSKGGELYAIQISQDYYSSTYGDKGYLFLMVDINDPKKPIIKVRTWQAEKDPDFGLYGPGDF